MIKEITHRISMMCRMIRVWHIGVLVIVAVAFSVAAQQNKDVAAVVIKINGALEYRANTSEEWKSAQKNQPLYNGYQLRTQLGNKAMIVYSSGTRILINENTELEIMVEKAGDKKKPSLERTKLITGEVFNKVKPKSNYEVETPSSVASVRGTEFNAAYGEGEASFLVVQSIVEVMNQLGSVLLEKNQMTSVPDGQAPGAPKLLTKSEIAKITKWTEDVEPVWKLNLVPGGGNIQQAGATFILSVTAVDNKGSVDGNASFKLARMISDPEGLEFSADAGKTWTKTPDVSIVNGQANVSVRGSIKGSFNIAAVAEKCEPAAVPITIGTPKQKKTIGLDFVNPDGTGAKSLEIQLEEK